jgi:chemotaxis protein histidine kinase CheA
LPKAFDKIRPEDVTDEFLKSIDSGSADIATLKLYIQNICPLVRSVYDRDTFLNGLIEDLYFKCEDMIQEKMNDIQQITKNKERLNEINELLEAMGSDAEKDPDAFLDNDGNPIKMKKKKVKMCESIQKKKTYKEDGIEMKTKDKYYIDNHLVKQNIQDPKSGTMKCIVCPNGRNCNHAHTAIELDLTPLPQKIKNLNGLIKASSSKLKVDKPLEPWRPCASDFKREGKLCI